MRKAILLFIVATVVAVGPSLAQSVVSETEREAIRGVPDRWGFTVGSFWQAFVSRVRLDGKTSTGTEINFERDLGLGKNVTNLQFGGFYRLGDRHRIDLSYVSWNRTKTRTIDRDIQWGDTIYHADGALHSEADAQLLNAIYRYSFFNNGKVAFGLNGGISALWGKFKLSGEGSVVGGPAGSGTIVETKTTVFPIPVVGAHFEMTLLKRLFWDAEGNFFAANVAGYDGNVTEFNTQLKYFLTRNIGIGGGYSSTLYRVTKEGSNGGNLFVRYGFSGVVANVSCVF